MPGQGSVARQVGLLAQKERWLPPTFSLSASGPVAIRSVCPGGRGPQGRVRRGAVPAPITVSRKVVGTLENKCPWGLPVSCSSDSTETNRY